MLRGRGRKFGPRSHGGLENLTSLLKTRLETSLQTVYKRQWPNIIQYNTMWVFSARYTRNRTWRHYNSNKMCVE